MKIVRLKGGLGNQMFQYAFAKLLELVSHDEVKLDCSAYSTLMDDSIRQPHLLKYNLSLPIATEQEIRDACLFQHFGKSQSNIYRFQTLIEHLFNRRYLFEWNRMPMPIETIVKYVFYDGYWQSYKYVDIVRDILLRDFLPKKPISGKTQNYISSIVSQPTTFVGIRRGDFLDERSHYGVLSNQYYLNAMNIVAKKCPNMCFLVFTNDVEWSKKNMDFSDFRVTYREKDMQVNDFEELMAMRSCQNAIISNSTFNWWGAYLIDNPQKTVVCPKDWFVDNKPIEIIPKSWVKLKR